MGWLPNLITLVRIPVIIVLVLPAFSLGWDSPKLAFWAYGIGILSHGLDGALAERLKSKTKPHGFWHKLDTEVLSLGLQLAAAAWLVHAGVLPWWIVPIYLVAALALQFAYIEPRKNAGRPFKPVVLWGSGLVWMILGVLLTYQAYQKTWYAIVTAAVLFIYMLIYANGLHPQVWNRWFDEADGKI